MEFGDPLCFGFIRFVFYKQGFNEGERTLASQRLKNSVYLRAFFSSLILRLNRAEVAQDDHSLFTALVAPVYVD